jgi:hypothetical protein
MHFIAGGPVVGVAVLLLLLIVVGLYVAIPLAILFA